MGTRMRARRPGAHAGRGNRAGILVLIIMACLMAACDCGDAISRGPSPAFPPVSFDAFCDLFPEWLAQFYVGPGPADYGLDPQEDQPAMYGVADVMYMLYTINDALWQTARHERQAFIDKLNSFQDPVTGLYRRKHLGPSLFKEHAVAFAAAALKLFGGSPAYPLTFLKTEQGDRTRLYRFLDTALWWPIWVGSHQIAAPPASVLITGADPYPEYMADWFAYMNHAVDPQTGYWQRPPHLWQSGVWLFAGSVHMYWVYHADGRPLPGNQEYVVDHVLSLQKENGFWEDDAPYGRELDGIYCLHGGSVQEGNYRQAEVETAIYRTLSGIALFINNRESLWKYYADTHHLATLLNAVSFGCTAYPHMCEGKVLEWRSALNEVPWM